MRRKRKSGGATRKRAGSPEKQQQRSRIAARSRAALHPDNQVLI
jgi:hypothetical protein